MEKQVSKFVFIENPGEHFQMLAEFDCNTVEFGTKTKQILKKELEM